MSNYKFDTLMVRGGAETPANGSIATPIYQTTAYQFESAEDAALQFDLKKEGQIYARLSNPTCNVLEKRLAALEGGVGAVAFASGMASVAAFIQTICEVGDEIIALSTLYGGTFTLFNNRLLKSFGVKANIVDPENFEELEKAINPKTRCIYIETMGNPNINIPDFERISKIAKANGLPIIADNTFGTPYLFDAKKWGIDFTTHSLTKYIGGHGNAMGGSITDLGTFDFKNSPRFENFNTPDPAYHGVVYADLGKAGFLTKLRACTLRDTGGCLSPFNAFLLIQGIETLSLRMERHSRNGEAIARFLESHPQVLSVNYPPLEKDRYHDRYKKYFSGGAGGILTFEIKGGVEAGRKFINAVTLFHMVANVSDVRSLIIHPASTTHSQLGKEELKKAGVAEGSIRLSIGLEDAEDLIEDMKKAFDSIGGK